MGCRNLTESPLPEMLAEDRKYIEDYHYQWDAMRYLIYGHNEAHKKFEPGGVFIKPFDAVMIHEPKESLKKTVDDICRRWGVDPDQKIKGVTLSPSRLSTPQKLLDTVQELTQNKRTMETPQLADLLIELGRKVQYHKEFADKAIKERNQLDDKNYELRITIERMESRRMDYERDMEKSYAVIKELNEKIDVRNKFIQHLSEQFKFKGAFLKRVKELIGKV